ncbi:MAG: PKD domain-containing protein [Thermoplasmata archaeon]
MKRKILSVSIFWMLLLSSMIALASPATESSASGMSQPVPNIVKIWEAYAKGWVKITSENDPYGSPTVFRVTNNGNVNVRIDEMPMLLSPHPIQSGGGFIQTTQDGALTTGIVASNSYVDYYYGLYTLPGWLFDGEKPWWCTEANQFTQYGATIAIGGEVMPYVLQQLVALPDETTNDRVWDHLWTHPTLVVGKTPLWKKIPDASNEYVKTSIAVTNIAVYINNGSYIPHARNSLVEDTVPKGYAIAPGSFDPVPDVMVVNPDGTKTLRWYVDVDAADVTIHNTMNPTPYNTVFLNYTLITPKLTAGRYFLERVYADVDNNGQMDAHSAEPLLEVYRVNVPPVPDAGGPYEVDEGSDATLDASGSTDPNGDPLGYRWDLDADGIWDTGWSPSPIYVLTCPDGPYETDVAVETTDGEFNATATTHYRCHNVPPTIDSISIQPVFKGLVGGMSPFSLYEGQAFTVTVTFFDPGWLDTHTAMMDWRDGQTTSPSITEENDKPYATGSFVESYIYGDDFDLGFEVTVTDDDGDSDVVDSALTVLNHDPIVDNLNYTVTILEPRTQGYWNHQCTVEEPYGDHTGIREEWIDDIATQSDIFDWITSEKDICEVLDWASGEVMFLRAQGQLMALWLNTVSGKLNFTTRVKLPGQSETTLEAILAWAEDVLLNSGIRNEHEEVKDVCDSMNNGMYIAIGDVHLSADIQDPGSDDIILSVDWGDGSGDVETFYNDGMGPDPPNSPWGNYPVDISVTAQHSYWAEGTYNLIIVFSDDDGGEVTVSLVIDIYAP